jgi:DMSO/TMAO reductase YedYZ molybdopterin-dependent catalytic subunit
MTQSTSGPAEGRPVARVASGLPGSLAGAVCGLLAAAVAIGVAQLLAGLSIPQSSPVLAVGQAAINLTPGPVKNWAVSSFGQDDKNVLLAGVVIVLFAFAAVIGMLAIRRLALGMAGLAIFAAIGLAAALTRNNASAGYALPTLGGAAVGAFALSRLVAAARSAARAALPPEPLPPIVFGSRPEADVPAELRAPDLSDELRPADPPGIDVPALRTERPPVRRTFLLTAGVTLAAAAAGEFAGRELTTRRTVSAARAAIRFPLPAVPAPQLPAGVNPSVPGISSFITPNGQFYRVDTALFLPQVDPSNWGLRIHGMVSREIVVTFHELLRRPLLEDYITLCCVSEPVDGPYIGNAKWLGASLASLLRAAGPLRGASQLLCTSVDGFTSGTPLSIVLDGRDALVAVAMNHSALPVEHGFPARLVVPGLYGYVSACKWVTDIEVTTFEASSAYWVRQGWSQQAPIKTESRIDVPASGSQVKAGRVAVAGVAWAQHKGIEAVEVRVDNGPWQEATLAAVPDIDCWRQWVWEWDAGPGSHTIEARATDKTGYTQTAVQAPVLPNGASGYPSATVTVS